VRLKGDVGGFGVECCQISIPSGAIKSFAFLLQICCCAVISIPSGAIKSIDFTVTPMAVTYFNSFWCD